MILSIDEMQALPECSGKSEAELKSIQTALELMIRKYTNNNFQNRSIRFTASSDGNKLNGCHQFLKIGDTIQISQTEVNDGLYVIKTIASDGSYITVDNDLFSINSNIITKIVYPDDIKLGVINLLKYEMTMKEKVGIQSETISRHSVTYFNQDTNNQVMGYPVALLGFLEPYKKARF